MRRRTCPCSSGKPTAICCGKLHRGLPASAPEELMRSRFSAFALGQVDYLIATTDPEGPRANPDRAAWRRELLSYCKATDFVELNILSTEWELGEPEGFVTFKVTLVQDGMPFSFVERSHFVRRADRAKNGAERWYYVDGEELEDVENKA